MSPAGKVRLIGGKWRGRLLSVGRVPGLRPTPNRVRETLFNWLAPDIQDLRVLDLFAGTGALGFEALSRGASQAVFCEPDAQAAAALRESAQLLSANTAVISQTDAESFLRGENEKFDLVFVDPPFQADLWLPVLAALPRHLAPGHRVYLETPAQWDALPEGWQILKDKRAGDVRFRLLAYSGSA